MGGYRMCLRQEDLAVRPLLALLDVRPTSHCARVLLLQVSKKAPHVLRLLTKFGHFRFDLWPPVLLLLLLLCFLG